MHKVVLITGISSGIGAATARALAGAGYRVFGGARAPASLAPIPGVEIIALDVRDEDQARRAVAQVEQQAGGIDILINNAGVSLVGPVEATSLAEARALFDTNVFGVLTMVQAVLPAMRARGTGLIVNISSVLGFLPAPFMGLYAASKHALEGLSETLDHEVRDFGVRVVLVEPSFTNTRLDTKAARAGLDIAAYAEAMERSTRAVRQQVDSAPAPETVAASILGLLRAPHRLRQPVDRRARLLSTLRRFAPARQVDKSLRGAFGL
jgi:NAD(P)-dependent dehydrogenase (short-subunit alcohol dehydrogenase family)